jgi:hypothetical protein
MLALSILLAATAAAPSAAELPVAPIADISSSFRDCLRVAAPSGFAPGALESAGWARATISTQDGTVPDGPPIYGHAQRAPLILLMPEERICTVMARVESVDAVTELGHAWKAELPKPDNEGMIIFSASGRPVVIRQTGTSEKPSLSISVLVPAENSK